MFKNPKLKFCMYQLLLIKKHNMKPSLLTSWYTVATEASLKLIKYAPQFDSYHYEITIS